MKYRYSIHYRCTCTGADGKLLGSAKPGGCPKLWRADGSWYAKHGSAGFIMRVPTGTGIRTLKRSGYTSKAAAEASGDRVVELLALASDEITARKIGDMVMAARRGADLPAVEDVRRRLMLGQAPDMTGETVGEFLDGWLAGKERAKRASTARSYAGHVRNYIRPAIGDVILEKIGTAHVEAVLASVDKSPGTRHRVLATLRAALNAAVKQRKIQFNPCVAVEMEPESPPEQKRWSAAEAATFIAATAEDALGLALRVAVLRGVRRGELLGLTWDGWDDERGIFTVSETLLELGGKLTAGKPKTRAGERLIFLDAETAQLVRDHRRSQLRARMKVGPAWSDNNLVFCKADGSPWHPDYVTKRFRKLCTAAGVPSVKLHEGGRHTGVSLMHDAGVRDDISMREAGHSDRTVHQRYNHPLIEAHLAAAEQVASLVKTAGGQA